MVKVTIEHSQGTVKFEFPETLTFYSNVGGRNASYAWELERVIAEGWRHVIVKALRYFTDGAHTLKKGTKPSDWTEEDFTKRDDDIARKLAGTYGEEPLPSGKSGDKRVSTLKGLLASALRKAGIKKVPNLGSTIETITANAVALGLSEKRVAKALNHAEKIAALFDLDTDDEEEEEDAA